MFRASLSNISLLRDSITAIAELIDEGIFKINKDGLSLLATDRAMVAAVDFNISAGAFDSFESDKEHKIGLNIANLLSVLKRAGAKDRLKLNLQEANLEIILENSSRRRFTLPLIDIAEEEMPNIQQLEFAGSAEIMSNVLQSGIEDAEIIADSILFESSSSRFVMRAEGDVSKTELELEKGNEALIKLDFQKTIRARYPLDYLKKIIKGAKIAETVKIEYGDEFPMKLTFSSNNKCRISFVLAPRTS